MRVLLASRVLDHLPGEERAALLAQNPIMISMDNATRTAFNTEACHRAANNLALPHCMVLLPATFNSSKYALTDADRANTKQLPSASMGKKVYHMRDRKELGIKSVLWSWVSKENKID